METLLNPLGKELGNLGLALRVKLRVLAIVQTPKPEKVQGVD
jgi:hypothetical protein